MAETFKFPNGCEVSVLRRNDVLACIDDNILDKEIAIEILERLEYDMQQFIKDGVWTGVPFMGSIRIPEGIKLARSEESKQILASAKETLSTEEFVAFKHQFRKDNATKIKEEKCYRYILSRLATRNPKVYKHLCKRKGVSAAKLILYSTQHLEYIAGDNDEFID